MKHISIERVVELLQYSPEDGQFRWKEKPNARICVGDVAGFPHRGGYWCIRVDGVTLLAHRVAFAVTFGRWPGLVDHRDGDKRNNRIGNLREASKSVNALNQRGRPRSSTGFRGVCWDARRQRFTAVLVRQYLGAFATAEEASAAYEQAKQEKFPEVFA